MLFRTARVPRAHEAPGPEDSDFEFTNIDM
jgi:hypothetical protein